MSKEKTEKLNLFETTKSKFDKLELEIAEKYNSLIKDETKRRQEQLKLINSTQLEAEEQLKNAKKYINESSFKEFKKNDDHSNKKEIHMPDGSPSVQRIQMESKCIPSLPLLKH